MAIEYLGPELDIHTGGVDNIFPHHTNEMAQSEAATDKPFATYWLHAEHLLVDGAKMSKSLGNFYTIPGLLERGYRPSAIRYLLLSAHYRKQLNFTLEGLVNAERALDRLEEFRQRLEQRDADSDGGGEPDRLLDLSSSAREAFVAAMDDDLNVSDALGAIFTLVRDGNRLLDESGPVGDAGLDAAREFLRDFDAVFGIMALRDRERAALPASLEQWIAARVAEREDARGRRDWERADAIRDELEEHGIVLEDGPEGTRWRVSGAVGPDLAAVSEPVDG
jgi:cysteinyl-tRNA synthetase